MTMDGLHLITPTSIAYTGTSASITGNGSVTFNAVSDMTLNGVFSADYDNYMVVISAYATGATSYSIKLTSGGTAETSGLYKSQNVEVAGTNLSAFYTQSSSQFSAHRLETTVGGSVWHFYGPYLAQPTALRILDAGSRGGAVINDIAGTHSLTTTYDGLYFASGGQTCTGRVAVYGMVK